MTSYLSSLTSSYGPGPSLMSQMAGGAYGAPGSAPSVWPGAGGWPQFGAPDYSVDPVSGGCLPVPATATTDFTSQPYDGLHPLIDDGTDWTGGNSLGDIAERAVSYGNWDGPGNRMSVEQAGYIAAKQAADPGYDPYEDPLLMNDPRYQPIDPIDAGGLAHDRGYAQNLSPENGMFGWEGMQQVQETDRALVDAVGTELDANGDKYSESAQIAAQGLEGFFGARVKGQDAVEWTSDKVTDVGQGVSSFAQDAASWDSVGDAACGIGSGMLDAACWAYDTERQAEAGMTDAYADYSELGVFGKANTIAGYANVAAAGGMYAAEQAATSAPGIYDWMTG